MHFWGFGVPGLCSRSGRLQHLDSVCPLKFVLLSAALLFVCSFDFFGFSGNDVQQKLAKKFDINQKGLEVCYCLWGVPSRPSPGSYPGPVQVSSRVRGGPVQIRHVLCFTVFRTHPGPEVGAIPARPGPILLLSVPHRIGPGRAETDFLATSE